MTIKYFPRLRCLRTKKTPPPTSKSCAWKALLLFDVLFVKYILGVAFNTTEPEQREYKQKHTHIHINIECVYINKSNTFSRKHSL